MNPQALTINTGIVTLCRTRSAVLPRIRSLRKRWPCVDMAIRSTCSSCATLTSSVAGSPSARRPCAFEAALGQLVAKPLQVGAIVSDLLRLAELEILEMPGRPPVGDVDEQKPRVRQPGQLLDVRQHSAVGVRVFDGNENVGVHELTQTSARAARR